jgi:phthalate 4,5-dioxygenase oxygenase subunit
VDNREKGRTAMNKEMAETLVRTGPGTPMGNLMRRYWVPILLSREVAAPDGPPVRAQILGEKLIAFRNSDGKVGLVDEFCSHRGASLYFGRNEENGIRCAYHGLKFEIDGQCVDVPSAPQACKHMGITAYPCIERAGMVWAYMGPKGKQPPPPAVEWCDLPANHVFVSKRLQECNYLQAMEGGIDTSHVSYVHRFEVDEDPMHQGTKANEYIKADGNVVFEIESAPFGLTLYGRRNGEPDSYYWRVTQWLFPWFTLIPPFGVTRSAVTCGCRSMIIIAGPGASTSVPTVCCPRRSGATCRRERASIALTCQARSGRWQTRTTTT